MMHRNHDVRGNRSINFVIIILLLMGLWVIGGIVTVMVGGLDSLSFTAKGHAVTIWLMVAFFLVASVYYTFTRVSKVPVVPWIIVILLVVLEIFLGISYFTW
jgi:phosphatidylglycerophosphate synthase